MSQTVPSQITYVTAISESHMTYNTSIQNGRKCLAYNDVSKYEQSQSMFKEIMAAEVSVPPSKWQVLDIAQHAKG